MPLDNSPPNPPPPHDGGTDLRDGSPQPGVPGWHWESPKPQGNNLQALWGVPGATSAQDTLYAAGDNGTLLIGGANGWQNQPGDLLSNRTFLGITGQNGTQPLVLAVGMFDLAMRRQAGQWSDLNPILGGGDGSLHGAWASPVAGEFFVVGTTGRMYWVRNNGSNWIREGAGVTPDSLFGVHGTGSGATLEVYGAGANGRIVHRTPGSMSWVVEADALVPNSLNAIWCGDMGLSGEVFAVGKSAIVLHKKGGTWASETMASTADLNAIWGYGDDIFTVGARGTVMHRQGGTWSQEAMGLTDERLSALWGTVHDGAPVVYAAGSVGTLLRRERNNWELLSSRVTTSPLAGVWARSANEYYAVGSDGVVLQRSGTGAGGMWTRVATGVTSSALNAVHGFAPSGAGIPDVYAVGVDGTILHQSSTGSGWAVEGVALTSAELTSVWVGADSVWVVGRGGRIGKKWTGSWSPENGPGNNPVTQDLYAVWGTGQGTSQVTFAAGSMGYIIRRANNNWMQEANGLTSQTIVSMFGASENDLWAFGDGGAVLHRVGGTWRNAPVGQLSGMVSGVGGTLVPGTNELYAVGKAGLILHLTNNSWLTEPPLTTLQSSAIGAAATNDVVSVGANGLILHKY